MRVLYVIASCVFLFLLVGSTNGQNIGAQDSLIRNLTVVVYHYDTGASISDATIAIKVGEDLETVLNTGEKGSVTFGNLKFPRKMNLAISISAEGFVGILDSLSSMHLSKNDETTVEYFIKEPEKIGCWGPTMILFEAGSTTPVLDGNYSFLREIGAVIDLMKRNPTFILAINGYCDDDELEKFPNGEIGLARIEFIISYIIEKGISKNRLEIGEIGLESCCIKTRNRTWDDEQDLLQAKQRNRRVTFLIASTSFGESEN